MRLPIRVRLTAWYAALLAVIIIALGAFLVLQLKSDLQARTDRDLREHSLHVAQAYAGEGAEDFFDVTPTVLPPDAAAQVLASDGRVLHSYGPLDGRRPLVPPDVLADAAAGSSEVVSVMLGPRDAKQRYRAIARPVRRLGRLRVVAVAESLKDAEESVERVLVLLLLAGPAALVATGLGGWWLARRALLPVDRMRSQAQEIGIDRLDERVAVPSVDDEVSRLAVTLNAMLDRLEQGVCEKHRLIADASHELRTPLAVMRAELDVSLRVDELPAAARAVLESAREEVDRMSRTVDNLLTLAQVDEGRLELLPTTVALEDAAEAAARPLQPLAMAKRIRLELHGGPCEARADAHRLHQALTNLIENAIKFTPAGGEVRVTCWRHAGEVGVTVADDGPGIPRDARAHIFDRFYRADAARGREAGGSGLGLAICREVAAAHGGRVWVDSQEGKGSAFSLALPAPRRSPTPQRRRVSTPA